MTSVEFFNFLAQKSLVDLGQRLNEFVGKPLSEEQKRDVMVRLYIVSLFGPAWPSMN